MPSNPDRDTDAPVVNRWASSGAMWLTGAPGGPHLGPPAPMLAGLDVLAEELSSTTCDLGTVVRVDPLQAIVERAAWAGLQRQGRVSCGGASRLLATTDGWVAITLARPEDLAAVPAMTQTTPLYEPWSAVEEWCWRSTCSEVVERATLLGVPVGAVGEAVRAPAVLITQVGDASPVTSLKGLVVADLSSMWAGPLCGRLLADAGCTVVKIESTDRPDGARQGPRGFYDLVHYGTQSMALRFDIAEDREMLHRVLARCDVVIEGSRMRALQQLGVDRGAMQIDGPRVWVTITGHGSAANRVGFGDDAAAAGGLVVWGEDGPMFCADAVADPITGLFAAVKVLRALSAGGRLHLDVSMSGVAAMMAGPTLAVPADVRAMPPVRTGSNQVAPSLGSHNDAVFARLGLG